MTKIPYVEYAQFAKLYVVAVWHSLKRLLFGTLPIARVSSGSLQLGYLVAYTCRGWLADIIWGMGVHYIHLSSQVIKHMTI